ncbi:MAG: substrate-binding domain-containing protein, partial [Ardenticatenaceae bacterium]
SRERLDFTFTGSLGGLIALGNGEADIAGSHLWDEESGTYNIPFAQRLLPGERVAVLTLAHRRLGLIVPPGNPAGITHVADLARPGLRLINRQRGAGSRVWLEAALRGAGIQAAQLAGYDVEMLTETAVAHAIAGGNADTGPGIEAAARVYSLDFVFLAKERYDLIVPARSWERPAVQALAGWLASDEAKSAIMALGGYDISETGQVVWYEF